MRFWSGPPQPPPPFETHLFEGGGGGVQNCRKNDPPPFVSKIINLLVFLDFEPKKRFRVPTPWGFVWAGVGRALMQFMHFSAILAMLVVLATSVTRGTHSGGRKQGSCDSICLLGNKRTFFASLALQRAGQNPCQRLEVIVSTNNGLHECMGRYTTCSCSFSPWAAQKSKFSKWIFFDIVTTQNDHPTYVKHVLGCIYVVFTLCG